METARKAEEVGLRRPHIAVPANSKECVDCHDQANPGIVAHWEGSTHAEKGVGCVECHQAGDQDADGYLHYGEQIATVVTPRDCSRCHVTEGEEFGDSHHAKAGNILASLDNFLAETVEGARLSFDPHSPTPGKAVEAVNGFASAFSGCQQCDGSKVALQATDGGMVTVADL
ncbi:MAG: hydroxylamine oxidoreductase, partial [bacterium]|nr:hydroxylamine oxidoreductase [bacterium]